MKVRTDAADGVFRWLLGSQFKILDCENLEDRSAVHADGGKESAKEDRAGNERES